MKIIRAEAMGLCFGVRDAIAAAYQESRPQEITILGQLVHNPAVSTKLDELGYRVREESETNVGGAARVMITAHGVSDRRREELARTGADIVDTTCPLVRRAHHAARMLAAEGRHVIVIGQPGHVEVRGLTEDLPSFSVAPSPGAVERYAAARLGVICQTTTTEPDAQAVLAQIRALNPHADLRFIDTICQPTKDRQRAMEALVMTCDLVVVVGGQNSNNTRKLVAVCLKNGVPAYHVESAADLCAGWFRGARAVGLTAGTSTLPETIEAVYEALMQMAESRDVEWSVRT